MTMATWWMFVVVLAGLGVGYFVYKGVGSADTSANFFGGMVGFLLGKWSRTRFMSRSAAGCSCTTEG